MGIYMEYCDYRLYVPDFSHMAGKMVEKLNSILWNVSYLQEYLETAKVVISGRTSFLIAIYKMRLLYKKASNIQSVLSI